MTGKMNDSLREGLNRLAMQRDNNAKRPFTISLYKEGDLLGEGGCANVKLFEIEDLSEVNDFNPSKIAVKCSFR